jgi:hypothetical protein
MVVIMGQIREKEMGVKVRLLNGYRLIGMGSERQITATEKSN